MTIQVVNSRPERPADARDRAPGRQPGGLLTGYATVRYRRAPAFVTMR